MKQRLSTFFFLISSEVGSLFTAIGPLIIPPLKDQDGQESEGAPLCQQPLPRERAHVLPLFQLKFGGTRCEDVSVGAVFKRISFTQTSLRVTLALLISEGLKGPMS